ncbi:MAG: hypothetical protein V5A39_05885 [Haloarculaceae archaeon]
MVDTVSMSLAVGAVALFGVAIASMAAGELLVAGLCFLSASIVIYLRETRLNDDGVGTG